MSRARTVAGYALLLLFVYLGAIICAVLWPVRLLLGPRHAKEAARAADQLVNATVCNGLGRESLSSASWRHQRRWVIVLTDWVDPGHCREANRREQPVVDFMATQSKE